MTIVISAWIVRIVVVAAVNLCHQLSNHHVHQRLDLFVVPLLQAFGVRDAPCCLNFLFLREGASLDGIGDVESGGFGLGIVRLGMLGVRFEDEWTEVGKSLGRGGFPVLVIKFNFVFTGAFE